MTERPHPSHESDDLESTANLLIGARRGDEAARNRLFHRYYAKLRAVAHGRLAPYQRTLADTDDLVQNTLHKAFRRLEQFEYRGEGAFLAYLRKILQNEILLAARKVARQRTDGAPDDEYLDPRETPSDVVARLQTFERYEQALGRLTETQRQAVIMRIDFGLSYQEIADALGKPTANAAHMFVARAVARVARLMRDAGIRGNDGDGR
jgi:RNA polymerase sigma-70 factor (ECF subfamily)